MSFLRIRENFRNGLWTKKMVAEAVNQGYINKAEYYAIVGEPYSKEETTEFSKFREVWKDQAMERSRVEGADVTFKFMTNFKRFIIDLCKGYV